MEQQGPSFGLKHLPAPGDADALSRSDEYERSLLVIVRAPSVLYVAAFHVLEEYSIEAETKTDMLCRGACREIYDIDERMKRFAV